MAVLKPSLVKAYVSKIQQQRVLVIGDLMLDQFIWGQVSRISPEAPVPVVLVTHDSAYPGGAANVARNLADFGIAATVGGVLGNDQNGRLLKRLFQKAGISTQCVLVLSDYSTIVKTRIIARHQQVVRVDREHKCKIIDKELQKLISLVEKIITNIDAIILEDYGKGVISQDFVKELVSITSANAKILAADPNINNPIDWSGVTIVKPNRKEAFSLAGFMTNEEDKSISEVGNTLLEKWKIPYLLITAGEDGMYLFQSQHEPYHTPTKAREVYDVSGAGDTAIALFTSALAAGITGIEAAEIANHAAGVVVSKVGTATLQSDELLKSFIDNG